MSVIVINPKNGQEIVYTEEEYGKAYIEACEWYRALENAVDASDQDQARFGEVNNRAPQAGSTDSTSSSDVPKSALT